MLCNVLPRHNWAISAGVILLEGFFVSDYRACCGFHFIAAWAHWWTGSSFIYSSWDPFTLILLLLGREEDEETPQSYLQYCALSFWWWFGISPILAASSFSPNPRDFCLDCIWIGLGRVWHVGLGGASKDGKRREGRTGSTEMERKIRKKKDKEHKHSCWFLSASQFEMNSPDFSLWFPWFCEIPT